MKIKNYLLGKMETGDYDRQFEIGIELNISSAQLSHYITGRTHQPSLDLAQRVYKQDGVVLWPFSEEAVNVSER